MNWFSNVFKRHGDAMPAQASAEPAISADLATSAVPATSAEPTTGGVRLEDDTARLQAVFDHAFDAIVVFDRNGRVRSVNRAAERLFERTVDQLLGCPFQELMAWGQVGPSEGLESVPFGSVSNSEIVRPDGSSVSVEFSLTSIGESDARIHVTIFRDSTERIRAEHRARSSSRRLAASNRRLEELNAQLEEASRIKTEFLANTSHELRTPLNGIIGFLQLVLDKACDSPEEEREFLEQAMGCSKRLLDMINDVLDIAKLESGKVSMNLQPIDLDLLFDEVNRLTYVQAAQKNIEIEYQVPTAAQYQVRGDHNKIKQVLINLVGNSLKFTEKGRVIVRAIEQEELGHFRFEIEDTGIGIAPERQAAIFEKFTQGDGSSTRRFGGAGLGLAISRSLVEMMGGIIGVQSEGLGRGTRMFFSLPIWRESEQEVEPKMPVVARVRGPESGPLVLVVEDDPVFRMFTCVLLNKHGYRTIEAADAESGWILARQQRAALVVLDYALASSEDALIRTGWDLAERLSEDPKTRNIPLVFLTGFDAELRNKLKTLTLARRPEHLMKPVDGGVLVGKIQEVLGASSNRTIRILLADDDPGVAKYIRKVLPEKRFELEVTLDGEECLHVLKTRPRDFDLLLLDLHMPDMSGYDVLKAIALNQTIAEIPVMVLTNAPEARDSEEKLLLEQELVLDVLSKSAVHENPVLLPHIIDWHLQVSNELSTSGDEEEDHEPRARAA